jgi:hypothetical protein
MKRAFLFWVMALLLGTSASGCRDTARFGNHGDHYEGDILKGSFIRSGLTDNTRACVTLDADHLQDAPGTVTTSDGRFRGAPLRPIPQVWHDPLSLMNFGEGRRQNLLYVATPLRENADVMLIVSLMDEGGVELRMLRGAPDLQADAGAEALDAGARAAPMFGIFALERRDGTCSF